MFIDGVVVSDKTTTFVLPRSKKRRKGYAENQFLYFRFFFSFVVLHLGNVYFHRKQLKHGQEGVEIGSDAEIRWTGHLLRLDVDGIKEALTTKTTVSV